MFKKIILAVAVVVAAWTAYFFGVIPSFRGSPEETKVYKIGILTRGVAFEPAIKGFRAKMNELGYTEDKNVFYDKRDHETKVQLEAAAREFVEKNYDLIFTLSTPATQAAYKATQDLAKPVPVVFGIVADPLAAGVIKSIQKSGTNATGIATLASELTAKRLEILREINPKIQRVAMPHSAFELGDVSANKSVEIAQEKAALLGIAIKLYPIQSSAENAKVAATIKAKDVEGIVIGGDSLVLAGIEHYAKQATSEKILAVGVDPNNVNKGMLMAFGTDYYTNGEQAASIAHKIFRGTDPAEVSIEASKKLLLTVNLEAARAIGLTFPEEFLKRVDVVVGKQ